MPVSALGASIPRRAATVVAGIALALTLGACSSSSKPGASSNPGTGGAQATAALLQQALREQVAGNLTQAEPKFLEVIRRDPGNKFASYDLGLIYQTQGKLDDAERRYRVALTVDAKFGPALYNLAILRTTAKDDAGATA